MLESYYISPDSKNTQNQIDRVFFRVFFLYKYMSRYTVGHLLVGDKTTFILFFQDIAKSLSQFSSVYRPCSYLIEISRDYRYCNWLQILSRDIFVERINNYISFAFSFVLIAKLVSFKIFRNLSPRKKCMILQVLDRVDNRGVFLTITIKYKE